ncbi:glutamate receptor 1-like [Copidosoma floridanum]|uniref:glutamate receptor 1-like n=1 Tax=Copidosoma floridanum TaxID=29053 RepID=UPI0006C9449A|nr:glutamate receptor 1-like [Copidosoma floridanum]
MTNIRNLVTAMDYHKDRTVRPFIMITLNNWKDFDDFVYLSLQASSLNYCAYLVIFSKNVDKDLMDVCENPKANYFHLTFNVKMLIYCEKKNNHKVNEWYALRDNETIVAEYATWSHDFKLLTSNGMPLFARRNSSKGLHFKVATVGTDAVQDHFKDILAIVAKIGDFRMDFSFEKSCGAYTWTGIMKKLANNDVDVGLGGFGVTDRRMKIIDFSMPFDVSPAYYYVREPSNRNLQWSTYYEPFERRSGCFLIFLIASTMVFVASTMLYYDKKLRKTVPHRGNAFIVFSGCFTDVMAIICKMPLINFTNISSIRIAYVSLHVLMFVISSAYSAILMSRITIFKPNLPFSSIDEFLADGTHKLSTVKDSSYFEEFTTSTNPKVQVLRNVMLSEDELPTNPSDAVKQICSGKRVVLYLDDYTVRREVSKYDCKLVGFERGNRINVAFAFPKHSPYVKLFNHG